MSRLNLARKPFGEGQVIFSQGDPGDQAYIVQSGSVEIVRGKADRTRVIGRITEGGLFGEMALLDNAPRMASARAATATICLVVPRRIIDEKLAAADPVVAALVRILLANARSLMAKS